MQKCAFTLRGRHGSAEPGSKWKKTWILHVQTPSEWQVWRAAPVKHCVRLCVSSVCAEPSWGGCLRTAPLLPIRLLSRAALRGWMPWKRWMNPAARFKSITPKLLKFLEKVNADTSEVTRFAAALRTKCVERLARCYLHVVWFQSSLMRPEGVSERVSLVKFIFHRAIQTYPLFKDVWVGETEMCGEVWVVTGQTGHPGEFSHTIRLWQKQNSMWLIDGLVARQDPDFNPVRQATYRLAEARRQDQKCDLNN